MELIVNVLATLEIIVFLRKILQVEFSKSKVRLILGSIVLIGARLLYTYCPDENIAMVFGNLFGNMIGIVILLDETLIRGILKQQFAFIYVCFLYMPFDLIVILLKSIIKVTWNPILEEIVLCIVVIVLMHIISLLLNRYRQIVLWIQEIPPVYYIISIIYGTTMGLLVTCIEILTTELIGVAQIFIQILMVILSIFMYVFGIGFALIDLWRKQHRRESELKDKYMHTLESYNSEREANAREVRRMKHDMNTHIRVLNEMVNEKDIEEVQNYLADISNHYDISGYKYINTGNVYVNSILAAGMQSAEDICFRCEGMFPEQTIISSFALCTIFSNLLSNSIEACKKLKETQKVIYIRINSNEHGWGLIFENPIEWKIDISRLGKQYTSKKDKDNHGFGLYNIHLIVKENNGIIDIKTDKKNFKVSVCIFNK